MFLHWKSSYVSDPSSVILVLKFFRLGFSSVQCWSPLLPDETLNGCVTLSAKENIVQYVENLRLQLNLYLIVLGLSCPFIYCSVSWFQPSYLSAKLCSCMLVSLNWHVIILITRKNPLAGFCLCSNESSGSIKSRNSMTCWTFTKTWHSEVDYC